MTRPGQRPNGLLRAAGVTAGLGVVVLFGVMLFGGHATSSGQHSHSGDTAIMGGPMFDFAMGMFFGLYVAWPVILGLFVLAFVLLVLSAFRRDPVMASPVRSEGRVQPNEVPALLDENGAGIAVVAPANGLRGWLRSGKGPSRIGVFAHPGDRLILVGMEVRMADDHDVTLGVISRELSRERLVSQRVEVTLVPELLDEIQALPL